MVGITQERLEDCDIASTPAATEQSTIPCQGTVASLDRAAGERDHCYAVGGVRPISLSRSFMSSHTGFFASGFRRRYDG